MSLKKMNKFFPLLFIAAVISAVIINIFTVQSISGANNVSINTDDSSMLAVLEKDFEKNGNELNKMKDDLGSWGKVTHRLIIDKYNQLLSKERIDELYNQGYSLDDISTAAEYAAASGLTPEKILSAKGTGERYTVKKLKDDHDNVKDIITDNNDRLWDKAIDKLGINLNIISKRLGLTDGNITEMGKKGLNQRQIFDVAILSQGFDKEPDVISSEIEKGKSRKVLDQKYAKEWADNHPQTPAPLIDENIKREDAIKRAYNITEDDISLFKQNGIDKLADMAEAKHLAGKYKTTIQRVINSYKAYKDWDAVSNGLEVQTNE